MADSDSADDAISDASDRTHMDHGSMIAGLLNPNRAFLKAQARPWEELRRGRRSVRWLLTVELMGPRGAVFQQQKALRVA